MKMHFRGLMLLVLLLPGVLRAQDSPVYYYEEIGQFDLGVIHDVTTTAISNILVLAGDEGLWVMLPGFPVEPKLYPSNVPIVRLAAIPESRLMAAFTGENTVILWDAGSGEQVSVLSDHTDTMTGIACCLPGADDTELMATASLDKTVRLWSLTGEPVDVFEGFAEGVTSVALMRNAELSYALLAAGSTDGSVSLWSIHDHKSLGTVGGTGAGVSSLAFGDPAAGALTLAIGRSDGSIQVWTAPTQFTFEYEGETYPVVDVPLESGVRPLALIKKTRRISDFIDPADPAAGIIQWEGNWRALPLTLTDGESWQESFTFTGHTEAVNSLHFSVVDRSILISNSAESTRTWNLTTGANTDVPQRTDIKAIASAAYEGAMTIYITDDNVVRWRRAAADEDLTPLLEVTEDTKFVLYASAFLMLTVSDDNMVTLWEFVPPS